MTSWATCNVVAESSDFTIKIEARARDGEVAKLMALTLADEFVDERTAYYAQQDKGDRIEVKIRSRAIGYDQISAQAAGQRRSPGAVLGLLLGVGLVLAADLDGGRPAAHAGGGGARVGPAGAGGDSRRAPGSKEARRPLTQPGAAPGAPKTA